MYNRNLNILGERLDEFISYAKELSSSILIDEKGTVDNPGIWKRYTSKLKYKEALDIIQNNKPHWAITCNNSYYFSIGGCNISNTSQYGEIFIFININIEHYKELMMKFDLDK